MDATNTMGIETKHIDFILDRLNYFAFYDDIIEYPGNLDESFVIGHSLIQDDFRKLSNENAIEIGNAIVEKIEKIKQNGKTQFCHCEVLNENSEPINDKNSIEFSNAISTFYRDVISEISSYGLSIIRILDDLQFGLNKQSSDSTIIESKIDYIERLPKRNPKEKENQKGCLYPKQLALLVAYLKELNVIVDVEDLPLSIHLHYMTGHSQQNIKTYLGGRHKSTLINDGRSSITKGRNKNLKLLKPVIDELQKRISDDINLRS